MGLLLLLVEVAPCCKPEALGFNLLEGMLAVMEDVRWLCLRFLYGEVGGKAAELGAVIGSPLSVNNGGERDALESDVGFFFCGVAVVAATAVALNAGDAVVGYVWP